MGLPLTNEGKNSTNRQNIESVLTLSETGGKLTLIELSIADKMHCFPDTRSADRARQGKRNESDRVGAQFKLGTGTGGAFTIPFGGIPFAHSSFLARYRWRPRVSFESTERCQV